MPGIDSEAKLVLHMNGTDASTTFTDSSSGAKTVTANGHAQIDTAQSKFGGASGLFDGTDDHLTSADSDDWILDGGSDDNAWTVDFWVRFNGDPGAQVKGLVQQSSGTGNKWAIYLGNNLLVFQIRSSSSDIVNLSNAWNPAGETWYHVAVVKQGATGYKMFVDGTQIGTTQTDTSLFPNFGAQLNIGVYRHDDGADRFLNGWLDEVRISKGVARWTGNFTPPTEEYSASTTYEQSVSGTLTSSGALIKLTKKVLAGTQTTSGALVKLTQRSLSGILATSGTLLSSFIHFLSLDGTLTSSGSLQKMTKKVLAGALTMSGSLFSTAAVIISKVRLILSKAASNTFFASKSGKSKFYSTKEGESDHS